MSFLGDRESEFKHDAFLQSAFSFLNIFSQAHVYTLWGKTILIVTVVTKVMIKPIAT